MAYVGLLLLFASLVMIVISVIMIITKAIGKNSWEKKKIGIFSGTSFGIFVLSIILIVAFAPPADPNKQVPAVSQNQTNQAATDKSAQSFNTAMEAFNQNDYMKAIPLFQAVDSKSPNYAEAQNKITECNDALAAQLVADAERCVNENNYNSAFIQLNAALRYSPNYAPAQNKIKEYNNALSAQLVADARRCLKEDNYDGALTQLKAALAYNPDSEAKTMIADVDKQKQAYLEKKKQAEIQAYKNSCQSVSYKVLNKNPDGHKGEKVKLKGQIMQIQEEGGQTFMLLSVTSLGYGYWTDNVAVAYYGKIDAYEEDVIAIYGDVTGAFSYKSRAGWDITVPGVLAKYVD